MCHRGWFLRIVLALRKWVLTTGTSPAVSHGLVLIGDLNGNMMGVDAATGDLRWITELDTNPKAIVTTSARSTRAPAARE